MLLAQFLLGTDRRTHRHSHHRYRFAHHHHCRHSGRCDQAQCIAAPNFVGNRIAKSWTYATGLNRELRPDESRRVR